MHAVRLSAPSVTASELVRHFGVWRERAGREPVHILHHGRPQLMLASLEVLEHWRDSAAQVAPALLDDLLDALAEPVMLLDRAGRITASGRAARGYFGNALAAGTSLEDVLPPGPAAYVRQLVERVAATGVRQQGELPSLREAGGRVELSVEPLGEGVVVTGRVTTLTDARDAALAQVQALAAAITAVPEAALMTIGPRGYLIAPDESLARVTGVALPALAGVRATTLFAIGSRVAVGDAIETAFNDSAPRHVEADLLVRGEQASRIDLGLAPLRHGLTTVAVIGVVARCDLSAATT